MINVTMRENTLTDGSKTYDVILTDGSGSTITLNAVTEADALALIGRLIVTIEDHAVNDVKAS